MSFLSLAQGIKRELDREKETRIALARRLDTALAFVADDSIAITYQTMGQYRMALMKLLSGRVQQESE